MIILSLTLAEFSYSTGQGEYDHDDQQQADNPAGTVSPGVAVTPGRKCADQHQNEYHYENGREHLASPIASLLASTHLRVKKFRRMEPNQRDQDHRSKIVAPSRGRRSSAQAAGEEISSGTKLPSYLEMLAKARSILPPQRFERTGGVVVWWNVMLSETLVPVTSENAEDGGRHGIWSRRFVLATWHSHPHHHSAGVVLAPLK
jgi:hypothetical protein